MKRVKKASKTVKWLEDNGYKVNSSGTWQKERSTSFNYAMFQYCGKRPCEDFTWHPEWLEDTPFDPVIDAEHNEPLICWNNNAILGFQIRLWDAEKHNTRHRPEIDTPGVYWDNYLPATLENIHKMIDKMKEEVE